MTADTDDALRRELAAFLHDEVNGVGKWSALTDRERDGWLFAAERCIAGPIAKHVGVFRAGLSECGRQALVDAQTNAALQAENARLTEERDEARADLETRKGVTVRSIRSANFYCSRAETAEAQLAAVTARVEALEAALRFYADPEIYEPHPHGPAFDRRDLSWHARALLPAKTNEDRHDD